MRRLLLTTVLALVALLAVAYGGTSWYLAYQVTVSERNPLEAHPASMGLAFEEVAFSPREEGADITLEGWHISVPEPKGTIIIVHGVNSNRADPDVSYLDMARALADQGFSSLLFDLRGHGESGGDKFSGGAFEKYDVLGAFDLLLAQGVSPDRIGVLGVSLGGVTTLLAVEGEPRLQAVVADSTFADLSDILVDEVQKRTGLPEWLVPSLVPGATIAARLAYGIDIAKLVPERVVEGLPYPILVIHGEADGRFPLAHARRLYEASAHPDTQLWMIPGAEHARTFQALPDEYIERVAAYFEARFQP